MTDEHDQISAAGSSLDAPSPVAAALAPAGSSAFADSPAPAGVFDGAWFRRERERIAVGRRAIAKHLQVAESRVIALETKGQQVPVPWLPLVATLGFRLLPPPPEQAAVRTDAVPSASESAPPAAEPAAVPAAPQVELQAVEAAPVEPSSSAEPVVEPAPLQAEAPAAVAPSARARSAPQPGPRIDGAWLLAERERLGMSRNTLRLLLNIHWATCARFEKQKLPIPRRYWPKLKELGFQFAAPTPVASVTPGASSAPPLPVTPTPLRGGWLRRERKRLGLSEREVWQAVKAHWRTILAVERGNRVIPAAWLPALQQLGMAALGAKAKEAAGRPRLQAVDVRTAETGTAAALKKALPAPPPPAPDAAESPRELLAMIVNYRLKLGRRSGQSAVETLGLIAHDLRTANLSQVVSHDQLAQALDCLLREG